MQFNYGLAGFMATLEMNNIPIPEFREYKKDYYAFYLDYTEDEILCGYTTLYREFDRCESFGVEDIVLRKVFYLRIGILDELSKCKRPRIPKNSEDRHCEFKKLGTKTVIPNKNGKPYYAICKYKKTTAK